jgi:hypothetical protein
VEQRSEDAHQREQARAEIGDRHAAFHRRRSRLAGNRHDARHALGDEIEPAFARVGTVCP